MPSKQKTKREGPTKRFGAIENSMQSMKKIERSMKKIEQRLKKIEQRLKLIAGQC